MRIAVGMSGGVDSSVAAALLKQQGHEVIGVCMALWDGEYAEGTGKHSCYGPEEKDDIDDARHVCDFLNIPFHVFDCAAEYKAIVLDYFRQEYAAGRTPNPCVKCNQTMKFGFLPQQLHRAGLQYDSFATGHYAGVTFDAQRQRYLLLRGKDRRKDQTYFIYRLSQEQLSRCRFPLTDYTKEEVRQLAAEFQLPTAHKAESQDFYCGDYQELLQGAGTGPGPIVDTAGKVLGRHDGIWRFTPGQRKGLGAFGPDPRYVIRIEAATNTVVVGTKEETVCPAFTVAQLNWIPFRRPDGELAITVKVRSAQTEVAARIIPLDDSTVRVEPAAPISAVAPGQSAVFYDDALVLGGGVIQG